MNESDLEDRKRWRHDNYGTIINVLPEIDTLLKVLCPMKSKRSEILPERRTFHDENALLRTGNLIEDKRQRCSYLKIMFRVQIFPLVTFKFLMG